METREKGNRLGWSWVDVRDVGILNEPSLQQGPFLFYAIWFCLPQDLHRSGPQRAGKMGETSLEVREKRAGEKIRTAASRNNGKPIR